MSEATLQRFMERLNEDADFRNSVQADPEGAFAALGLSPAEQAALTSGDEDALRRLSGTDTSAFRAGTWFLCTVLCPKTPGSGDHCGTGPGGCPTYDDCD
jgi:hypothetical protein